MDEEDESLDAGTLFVLGNFLLDIIVSVDESYLERYGLTPDSSQTAQDNHLKIYDEVVKFPGVKFSPGGSASNTVRLVQKILGKKDAVTLVGAVGSDEDGKMLLRTLECEGIKVLAQLVKDFPTGKCASLVTSGGSERTMVTSLGASLKFSHETFMKDVNYFLWLERANFVYISGYFLKVSPNTVFEVVKRAKSRKIPVLLNLNAVWVTVSCKAELAQLIPFLDVIFGNESEAVSFADQLGLCSEDIFSIARELSLLELNGYRVPQRIVVITRGDKSVICSNSGGIREYPVPVVPKDSIVDTTGAGDAFVGGFLAKYVQGRSLNDCLACGLWAATEELKDYGFIIPNMLDSFF